ncbi:hypothetical protein BN7_6111 [Wickerhamomyces ciferrii]|uniref:Uncharacterized protein n=1 Tax=Wickerhamomyces ciferrii (strain ATCC 14091 / BCRC 22168 / CBS 111 / JCM 3599 / NBRC 0793 / NRRL Y-1031 F-60-10) TaxID=1206466 RepID=K0KZF9_WICCF|nr:uncharacterized protein BN7_6111 [Wickerhamomyces ciferrii]CCH46518.1 hypothetical protein BN7_6111 [Wickerhamomyces ciferrii]
MIKFLLDWPWKWYGQINEIKQKLYTLLESTKEDQSDFQKITIQNLTILKIQQFCALIMCIGSPFLSGFLLLFARDYIIIIGNDDGNDQSLIFSDLNIGIFVSCGILRVVIQISEHIQQSTASIESKTEKFISEHNHFNSLDIELRHKEINQNVQLLDRITILERQMNQMSKKFEIFYNNNKFIIENNMTLLTSKHFKILEKEINELHYNIHTRTNDLDSKIHSIITTSSTTTQSFDNNQQQHHQYEKENLQPIPSNSFTTPQIQNHQSNASLHGIPLSPKSPSYHPPSPPSILPFEQYTKLTQQLPSPLSKITSLIPILNPFQDRSTTQDQDIFDAEITMKELSNLDALNKFNLGSRPIVEYVINIPFAFKSFTWFIISHIPINVLKIIYFVLLGILDILVSRAGIKDDQHELEVRNRDHKDIKDRNELHIESGIRKNST